MPRQARVVADGVPHPITQRATTARGSSWLTKTGRSTSTASASKLVVTTCGCWAIAAEQPRSSGRRAPAARRIGFGARADAWRLRAAFQPPLPLDVVFGSAEGVEQDPGRLQNPPAKPAVELYLDRSGDCWGAILRVPCDMRMDF